MLTYRDFLAEAHSHAKARTLKITCCVRGCKRSLRLNQWQDEWKEAEGWAPIDALTRELDQTRAFLCPLHYMGLVDGKYYMTESFSGSEQAKAAELRIKELEQRLLEKEAEVRHMARNPALDYRP